MANLVTHPAIRDALRLLERDSMRFGDDVREQRLRIGASLRDVARVAGVSPAMVWRVERGDPAIGPESRAAIARAVGGTARTAFYVDATPPIHDAAHSRIVERVVALAAPGWRVRVELVVPGGHGRSVDVALDDRAQLVLLEIESKVRRWEERLRMLEDKRAAFMRAGESRPIFVALVLPPTRHHQALVRRLPATTASRVGAEPRGAGARRLTA